MDNASLVEQQIDDGQEFIDSLTNNTFDVSAAAWVKPSEEDRWLLYLVSKEVDKRGLSAAFRAIHPVLGNLSVYWITLGDLKLIGPSNPIAADIIEINRKYPGRVPTRTRRSNLGGLSIIEHEVHAGRCELQQRSAAESGREILRSDLREFASLGNTPLAAQPLGGARPG